MTLVSGGVELELPMIASESGAEWIPPAPGTSVGAATGRDSSGVPTTLPAGQPARSKTVPLAAAPAPAWPAATPAPVPAYGPPAAVPYSPHTPQALAPPAARPVAKTSATAVIVATLAVLAAIAGTAWKLRSARPAAATPNAAPTPAKTAPEEVVGPLHGLVADGHSNALYMLMGDHVSRVDRDTLAVAWSATYPHVVGDSAASLTLLDERPTGKPAPGEAGAAAGGQSRLVVVRDVHVRMYDPETGEEVAHFVRPDGAGTDPASALCASEGGQALVVYGTRTVAFHPTKKIATLLADVGPSARTPCEVPDEHCDVGVSCKVSTPAPKGLPAGCVAATNDGRDVVAYCPTAATGRILRVDGAGKKLFEKEEPELNSSQSFAFFSLRRDVLHVASAGKLFTFDSADGTLLWSKAGKFRADYRHMGRIYGEVDGRVVALDARTGQERGVVGGR